MPNLKLKRLAAIAVGIGAIAGCRATRSTEIAPPAMTLAEINAPPPGIPSNAICTFAGRPDHTKAMNDGKVRPPGTMFIYDDTENRIIRRQRFERISDSLTVPPFEPTHDYRGFFAPDAGK